MTLLLRDCAVLIRSKNAGPFLITLDCFFKNEEEFALVRKSEALTREALAKTYSVPVSLVQGPFWDVRLNAVKITIPKLLCVPGTSFTDQFGSSQHVLLSNLQIS